MNKNDFLILLDEMLEFEPGTLKGDEKLEDLGNWDSLAILDFIALVDEKFKFVLSPADLKEVDTVDGLVGLLGNKLE